MSAYTLKKKASDFFFFFLSHGFISQLKVTQDVNKDDDLAKNYVIPQLEQDHFARWHLTVTVLKAVICINALHLYQ